MGSRASAVRLLLASSMVASAGRFAVAAPDDGQGEAPVRETLTFEAALTRVLATHPEVVAARARVEAAEHGGAEVARHMAPSVHLSDEIQYYDKPFAVAFALGPPTATPAPELVVRDQFTHTFAAAVNQPVVGLGHLNQERLARDESAKAQKASLAALEASIRQSLAASFLSHFEARALEDIASSSVKELGEQLTVARARLQSGVITNADLLRVETAVASAEQQVIAARSQARVARSTVLAAVGYPVDDSGIELAEPRALLAAAESDRPVLGRALAKAAGTRPEIAGRLHEQQAAEHEATGRGLSLLPEVNLEAAYLRVDGQQFAPKNSGFVGVKAEWSIWEWGATVEGRRGAAARARAAAAQADGERRRIAVDVASSVEQGEAARASVTAAEKAVASAQEAYRVTSVQLKAGAATTTDLLEAQAALSQARLNLTRAHYALAQAHVSYQHAIGE